MREVVAVLLQEVSSKKSRSTPEEARECGLITYQRAFLAGAEPSGYSHFAAKEQLLLWCLSEVKAAPTLPEATRAMIEGRRALSFVNGMWKAWTDTASAAPADGVAEDGSPALPAGGGDGGSVGAAGEAKLAATATLKQLRTTFAERVLDVIESCVGKCPQEAAAALHSVRTAAAAMLTLDGNIADPRDVQAALESGGKDLTENNIYMQNFVNPLATAAGWQLRIKGFEMRNELTAEERWARLNLIIDAFEAALPPSVATTLVHIAFQSLFSARDDTMELLGCQDPESFGAVLQGGGRPLRLLGLCMSSHPQIVELAFEAVEAYTVSRLRKICAEEFIPPHVPVLSEIDQLVRKTFVSHTNRGVAAVTAGAASFLKGLDDVHGTCAIGRVIHEWQRGKSRLESMDLDAVLRAMHAGCRDVQAAMHTLASGLYARHVDGVARRRIAEEERLVAAVNKEFGFGTGYEVARVLKEVKRSAAVEMHLQATGDNNKLEVGNVCIASLYGSTRLQWRPSLQLPRSLERSGALIADTFSKLCCNPVVKKSAAMPTASSSATPSLLAPGMVSPWKLCLRWVLEASSVVCAWHFDGCTSPTRVIMSARHLCLVEALDGSKTPLSLADLHASEGQKSDLSDSDHQAVVKDLTSAGLVESCGGGQLRLMSTRPAALPAGETIFVAVHGRNAFVSRAEGKSAGPQRGGTGHSAVHRRAILDAATTRVLKASNAPSTTMADLLPLVAKACSSFTVTPSLLSGTVRRLIERGYAQMTPTGSVSYLA